MNYLKLIAVSFILVLATYVNAQNVKKDTVFNRSYNLNQILNITTTTGDLVQIEVFHYNGVLKSIKKYKSDKLDGEQKEWYENGNLNFISNYVDGFIVSHKEWYDNGILKSMKNYYQYPSSYPLKKSSQLLHGEYVENYKNGISRVTGYYDSGQRTGKWIEHYESGNKLYECEYRYGLKSGKFKQYYPNGKTKSDLNYSLVKKDKSVVNTYGNVNKISSNLIHDPSYYGIENNIYNLNWVSIMHGKQSEYSELGDLLSLSHYKMGVKHGVCKTWNSNKQLLSWIEYKNGIVNGKNYTYYNNGYPHKLIHENPKYENLNSLPNYDKSYKTYFINGKPEVIGFYKNGKLHGPYLVYNQNGQLVSSSNFNDGLREGEQLGFNSKGKLISKSYYKIIKDSFNFISVLDGESLSYYENGTLLSKGTYTNGVKNGIWKTWFKNGQLSTEENYCNGLYCSSVFHYDEEGKLIVSQRWKVINNNQIQLSSKEFKNGILIQSKYFNDDNKTLKEIYYHGNGVIKNVKYYYHFGNKKNKEESNIYRDLVFFDNGNVKADRFTIYDYQYLDKNVIEHISPIGVELKYYKNGMPMSFNNYSSFDSVNFQLFWDPVGKIVNSSFLNEGEVKKIYNTINTKFNASKINLDTLLFEGLNPYLTITNSTNEKSNLIFKYWNEKPCIEFNNFNDNEKGKFSFLSNSEYKIIEGEMLKKNKHGTWRYYIYPSKLKSEVNYNEDTCYIKSFYPNFNLSSTSRKVNGIKNGESITYYENKIKHTQMFYKNGQLQGGFKSWYESGVLEKENQYLNGSLNGESKEYWENGNIKVKGIYRENYKEQVWFYYDSLGKPFVQMDYVNGQENLISFYSRCHCENSDIKMPETLNPWTDLSNTDWFSKYYNFFSNQYNQSILGFTGLNSSENNANIQFNLVSNSRLFFKSNLNGFYINSCFSPSKKLIQIPIEYHKYGKKDYIRLGVDRLSYSISKRIIEPVELHDKNNNLIANGWHLRNKFSSEINFKVKDVMLYGDSLVVNQVSDFCFTPSFISGTDIFIELDTASIVSVKKIEYNSDIDSSNQFQLLKNYAYNNLYRYGISQYGIESQKLKLTFPMNLFDTSFQKLNVNVSGMAYILENNLISSMKFEVLSNNNNIYEVLINGIKMKFNIKDFSLNLYKRYKMRTSYNYIKKNNTLVIYLNKNNY